jgi:thiol-disulfide isomerase/thioredoxin
MSVIPERERAHVKEILDKGMMGDVTLVNFTQEFECDYCRETRQLLQELSQRLAHQFAFENQLIRADMIESSEFPQLVGKYQVMAVPKVVINDAASFEGALPEQHFLQHVLLALEDRSHS